MDNDRIGPYSTCFVISALKYGINNDAPSTRPSWAHYSHISIYQELECLLQSNNHAGGLLDSKDLANDARPSSFSTLGKLLLYILSILRRNNFLARLGMIHHRIGVGEEMVEGIVEDAGTDEGVDIADGETVFIC